MSSNAGSPPRTDGPLFPFLQLPGELRIMVYRRLYTSATPIPIYKTWQNHPPSTPKSTFDMTPLRTNRQLKSEIEDIFYANAFTHDIPSRYEDLQSQTLPNPAVLSKLRNLMVRCRVYYYFDRIYDIPEHFARAVPVQLSPLRSEGREYAKKLSDALGKAPHALRKINLLIVGHARRVIPNQRHWSHSLEHVIGSFNSIHSVPEVSVVAQDVDGTMHLSAYLQKPEIKEWVDRFEEKMKTIPLTREQEEAAKEERWQRLKREFRLEDYWTALTEARPSYRNKRNGLIFG